jgi:hypothetical protein
VLSDCSPKKRIQGTFELVTFRHGEFKLVEPKETEQNVKIIFQKEQEIFRSPQGTTFQFYKSFQLGNEDVVLFLSENPTEPTCSGKFFLASVQKETDVVFLPEFGNCSDTPEITEEVGKITFRFNSTKTELSQTVVYSDRKLEVTESKLSKK